MCQHSVGTLLFIILTLYNNPTFQKSASFDFLILILFCYCVCLSAHMVQCAYGGQRTAGRSQFSSSSILVLGIKFKSGQWQVPLPIDSSFWPQPVSF